MRRAFAAAASLLVFAACGGDDDDTPSAKSAADVDVGGTTVSAPEATETEFGRECPLETSKVVAVLDREVTQDGDACAWRGGNILVSVDVFGPGGQGFLETWREEFEAQHDEVRTLDRGDGGSLGLDGHQGQGYVETGDGSWLIFVGSVECFEPDHYAQALTNLFDVILGEPATAVDAPATCDTSESETVETTP